MSVLPSCLSGHGDRPSRLRAGAYPSRRWARQPPSPGSERRRSPRRNSPRPTGCGSLPGRSTHFRCPHIRLARGGSLSTLWFTHYFASHLNLAPQMKPCLDSFVHNLGLSFGALFRHLGQGCLYIVSRCTKCCTFVQPGCVPSDLAFAAAKAIHLTQRTGQSSNSPL